MRKKSGIVAICLSLLLAFTVVPLTKAPVYAADVIRVTVDGLNYDLNTDDMTATVVKQSDQLQGDVTIPEVIKYDGAKYTVTIINTIAFTSCSSITGITIPASVTRIEQGAFAYTGIQHVIFMPGSKLEFIGECAFERCTELTDITIPAGVKTIDEFAFSSTGLKSITFLKGSKLEFIGDCAFERCTELKSIKIPASTKSICSRAFYECGLRTVSIDERSKLETIGERAFYGCTGIERLTVPRYVTEIGGDAFNGCESLSLIHYFGTQQDWERITDENWAGSSDPDVHFVRYRVTKATPETYGEEKVYCTSCDEFNSVTTISKPDHFQLSSSSYTYNGNKKTPDVTVTDSDSKAVDDSNYDVSYSQNVNAGKATATVTFKGDYYAGSKDLTFTINKASNPLKVSGKTATVKYSKLKKADQKLAVTKVINFKKEVKDKKNYTLSSAKKGSKSFKKYFKVNKTTGKVTVKKGLKKGKYKVTVKVKALGNSNYNAVTKTVTFKVKVK